MNSHEFFSISARGLIGIGGSTLAVIMPWQENVEWGITVLGGALGILVAILAVISFWRGLHKK